MYAKLTPEPIPWIFSRIFGRTLFVLFCVHSRVVQLNSYTPTHAHTPTQLKSKSIWVVFFFCRELWQMFRRLVDLNTCKNLFDRWFRIWRQFLRWVCLDSRIGDLSWLRWIRLIKFAGSVVSWTRCTFQDGDNSLVKMVVLQWAAMRLE